MALETDCPLMCDEARLTVWRVPNWRASRDQHIFTAPVMTRTHMNKQTHSYSFCRRPMRNFTRPGTRPLALSGTTLPEHTNEITSRPRARMRAQSSITFVRHRTRTQPTATTQPQPLSHKLSTLSRTFTYGVITQRREPSSSKLLPNAPSPLFSMARPTQTRGSKINHSMVKTDVSMAARQPCPFGGHQ